MTAAETAAPASTSPKPRRSHKIAVALLLILGALLTPLTIITIFVKTEITDTSRFVQTVRPLSTNPDVQAYVADTITNNLFSSVDVNTFVSDALPGRAEALAGPIAGAVRSFTHEAVLRVLQSEQFQKVWDTAMRVAHEKFVNVLTGEHKGAVSTANGKVTVDLAAAGEIVKTELAKTGISAFEKIPTDKLAGTITLFESEDIYRARKAVGVLEKLAYILPFVVVGVFGLAVFLSKDRRRGFVKAAIAFTLGALVLAIGLAIGRGQYLSAVSKVDIPRPAAAAVYDALVRFLHTSVRAVLAFSIAVVVAAIFSGPSRLAVWFRTTVHRVVDFLGRASDEAGWRVFGSVGFIRAQKRTLRIATAVIGFVVLLLWDRPTPAVIFWTAIVVLAVLALIEFYGRDDSGVTTATPVATA